VHVCQQVALRSARLTLVRQTAEEYSENMGRSKTRAAIGFTVKSGWASAVLLAGSAELPQIVDSRRIELSDPAIPESRQPYHAGFGTAREAGPELSVVLCMMLQLGAGCLARSGASETCTHWHRISSSSRRGHFVPNWQRWAETWVVRGVPSRRLRRSLLGSY